MIHKIITRLAQVSLSTPPARLSHEEILNILLKNVPAGYRYYLTLVSCKTDSLEKVLKNQIIRNNQNN